MNRSERIVKMRKRQASVDSLNEQMTGGTRADFAIRFESASQSLVVQRAKKIGFKFGINFFVWWHFTRATASKNTLPLTKILRVIKSHLNCVKLQVALLGSLIAAHIAGTFEQFADGWVLGGLDPEKV